MCIFLWTQVNNLPSYDHPTHSLQEDLLACSKMALAPWIHSWLLQTPVLPGFASPMTKSENKYIQVPFFKVFLHLINSSKVEDTGLGMWCPCVASIGGKVERGGQWECIISFFPSLFLYLRRWKGACFLLWAPAKPTTLSLKPLLGFFGFPVATTLVIIPTLLNYTKRHRSVTDTVKAIKSLWI